MNLRSFFFYNYKDDDIDFYLDLYILTLLENHFLEQKTWYVNINQIVDKEYIKRLWVGIGYFRKRVFYNVGFGFIKLKKPSNFSFKYVRKKFKEYNIPVRKIFKKTSKKAFSVDPSLYYKYILEVKITKPGLEKLEELRNRQNKSILMEKIKKINKFSKDIFYTKKVFISVWSFLVSLIVVFTGYDIYNNFFKASIQETHETQKYEYQSIFKEVFKDNLLERTDIPLFEVEDIELIEISENQHLFEITYIDWTREYFLLIDEDDGFSVRRVMQDL